MRAAETRRQRAGVLPAAEAVALSSLLTRHGF